MKVEYTDNYGGIVVCDFCNADGDILDDEGEFANKGGMIMGSHAICGRCCKKNNYVLTDGSLNLEKFKDEPVDNIVVFDQEMGFGVNVREWRLKVYDTTDAISQFITFDDNDEMFDYMNKNKGKK